MLRQGPSSILGLGLAAAFGTLLGLSACTSSDNGGVSAGGTAGTGGTATGSDGGGGSESTGSGSTSTSAGSTGASSTGGTGACPAPTMDAAAPSPTAPICTGNAPAAALVGNFDNGMNVIFSAFGSGSIAGGTYVYPGCSNTIGDTQPMYPLSSDFSGNDWHVSGTVGTYSGFGVYWSCSVPDGGQYAYTRCSLDASMFTGVQFDIGGDAGPSGKVTFAISSANENPVSTDPNNPDCNSCDTEAGACKGGSISVNVTSAKQTVTVKWSDLMGVTPAFDPAHLAPFQWQLDYAGTNYPVNLTIDNIQFTTN